MPKLHLFSGPPCSGKSTVAKKLWRENNLEAVYLSTDYFIERYAAFTKQNYKEVFRAIISRACERLNKSIKYALQNNRDVIWDQTNVSKKLRLAKLKLFPNYEKILYQPKSIDIKELLSRNDLRPRGKMEFSVIRDFVNRFELVDEEERKNYEHILHF